MNHLDTLELRLSNERMRLANAKTPQERALREAWVAQIEREIAAERRFLAKDIIDPSIEALSDDELYAALCDPPAA